MKRPYVDSQLDEVGEGQQAHLLLDLFVLSQIFQHEDLIHFPTIRRKIREKDVFCFEIREASARDRTENLL